MTQFAQPDTTHWGGNRDIQRDQWGRPLVTPPDGGKPIGYTRCTTFVDALSDKSNLMAWRARMAGLGLAHRDDLLLQLAQHDPEDKRGLDRIIAQAADAAGASTAADIGTAIHEATERHDLGQEVGPLGKYQADLDAYIQATSNIQFTGVEVFRVHDDLQIGGTADRTALINGKTVICDIKTGGLYEPSKFAMQLSVYSQSVPYDPATGQRSADEYPVDTEQGLLIHLPAGEGRCDLYWLNLAVGWEGVQLSKQVRQWRQFQSRKSTRGQVITPANI